MRRLAAILGLLALVAIAALAQDASEPESDNGFLMNLLEQPALDADAADPAARRHAARCRRRRGSPGSPSPTRAAAWLEIDNVELDWSRLALLRGRVNINRLSAERITWLRRAEAPAAAARAARAPRPGRSRCPSFRSRSDLAELALAERRLRRAGVRTRGRALGRRLAEPRARRARDRPRRRAASTARAAS